MLQNFEGFKHRRGNFIQQGKSAYKNRTGDCTDPGGEGCIQLFRERLSEKMCTRQPRKVIWDMINTLFLTTVAVETNFFTFLWHSQTYVRGLPCNSFKFLRRTGHSKLPTIPFGVVACTFSDNLSRNTCKMSASPQQQTHEWCRRGVP